MILQKEIDSGGRSSSIGFAAIVIVMLLTFGSSVSAQEIAKFFKQNCTSCHWIGGGRLIGPDLKDVSERQERDWLIRFITDPKSMLDARDPYAVKLQTEAKGAIMINVPGMTPKLAEQLLDLINAESKLDTSQFAGKLVVLDPFSEEDATRGSELFAGKIGLSNSGPACVTCHTVNLVGSSIGGRLGPDLTDAFERLQGRMALTAWLSAPPTETMKSIFGKRQLSEDEIKYLVAYIESASGGMHYSVDTFLIWLGVILCGLGGGVFGLVIAGGIWSGRFRAVRRPLVKATKK